MILLDPHLHVSEHSPDSHLPVREAIRRAREMGLGGLCVTDHDTLGIRREAEALRRECSFPIFVGLEVLTAAGDFVVWGMDYEPDHIPSAAELMERVAACGGAAVAAHPYRDNGRGAGDLMATLTGLAGVECFNGSTTPQDNLRALEEARRLGLACLGAGDAHRVDRVGRFATRFLEPVHDERDIVRLIRAGRCEPVAWDGSAFVSAEAWCRRQLTPSAP